MKRKATDQFFDTHPVFSLEEAEEYLTLPSGRKGTIERIKYYLDSGKLKGIVRGVYAVVPPGVAPGELDPPKIIMVSKTSRASLEDSKR